MKRYLIKFTVSGRDKGNDKPMQYVYTARNDEDVQGIKESVWKMKEEEIESCKNCVHLRKLWWWKEYPKEKQYGWCCNLFDNNENDYTLMQLYPEKGWGFCECYQRRDK